MTDRTRVEEAREEWEQQKHGLVNGSWAAMQLRSLADAYIAALEAELDAERSRARNLEMAVSELREARWSAEEGWRGAWDKAHDRAVRALATRHPEEERMLREAEADLAAERERNAMWAWVARRSLLNDGSLGAFETIVARSVDHIAALMDRYQAGGDDADRYLASDGRWYQGRTPAARPSPEEDD